MAVFAIFYKKIDIYIWKNINININIINESSRLEYCYI